MTEQSGRGVFPHSTGLAQDVWLVVATAVAYYLGALLGFALTLAPLPVAILWPPNAILMAGLFLAPKRLWPAVLAAVLIGHLASQFQSGIPVAMVLCWYISNSMEAMFGAWLFKRFGGNTLPLHSVRSVEVFFAGAVVSPFLTSFVDAGFVALNGWGNAPYWEVWKTRFASNLLATLTIVPFVVTTVTSWAQLRQLRLRRFIEGAATLSALVFVCWTAFGLHAPFPDTSAVFLYLPIPLLVLAAVRLGPWGASAGMLLVTVTAIWETGQGYGPFVTESPAVNGTALQWFLVVAWIPIMLLAAVLRERQVVTAEAVATKEQLALAVEAAQLGQWEWDLRTESLWWSDITRRLYEIDSDTVVAPGLTQRLIHSDDVGVIQAAIAEAQRGRSFDVEFRVRFADGRIKWINTKARTICDADGRPIRVAGVTLDVTDRKQAELQRHERHRHVADSSRLSVAGEMTALLAHELNQPLAAILANARAARRFLMHDPPNLPELLEILESIAHDNRRAASVVTKFTEVLNQGQAIRGVVEVNQLVTSVLDIAEGDIISRGVSLTRQLSAEVPPVFGDLVHLQQVLLNLIVNACDAMESMPADGRLLLITTAKDDFGDARITVSDTGPGVSTDRSGSIFEPFHTTKANRLGLGLAICRSIVANHDGRIWVSTPDHGGGARFTVLIPALDSVRIAS